MVSLNTLPLEHDESLAGLGDAPKREFKSDKLQFKLALIAIVITGLGPAFLGSSYWDHTFQLVHIYLTVAILQNFLFVDAGQKSFGQGAILGMGTYGLALGCGVYGLSFGVGIGLAMLCATLGGLLFALPALRVQGFHLGFVTLSAAIVFPQLLIEFDEFTYGINGISYFVPSLTQPVIGPLSYLNMLLTLLPLGAIGLHYGLRNMRLGRRMRIAAESREAAGSLGIRPGYMRALAFTIVSIGTGLAGALYVPVVGFVSPESFLIDLSFTLFFIVVVGGRGQIFGPIVGIWVIYILPHVLLVDFVEYRLLIYGVVTLFIVLAMPDGLVGTLDGWRRKKLSGAKRGAGFDLKPFMKVMDGLITSQAKTRGTAIIATQNVVKRFGHVVALDGVDFDLHRGEIHALVGANGSGKTSLLNVLSGFSHMTAGSYLINGVSVARKAPAQIAKAGIGRTFQKPRVFMELSVWDNIQIGLDARSTPLDPQLQSLANWYEAAYGQDSPALLAHGQRRLLEVIRVIFAGADVLLLDEPAAGLSGTERAELSHLLFLLKEKLQIAIVIVEHDLDLVWNIADRITVLETGSVVASGTPQALATDPAVQHLFIGGAYA